MEHVDPPTSKPWKEDPGEELEIIEAGQPPIWEQRGEKTMAEILQPTCAEMMKGIPELTDIAVLKDMARLTKAVDTRVFFNHKTGEVKKVRVPNNAVRLGAVKHITRLKGWDVQRHKHEVDVNIPEIYRQTRERVEIARNRIESKDLDAEDD